MDINEFFIKRSTINLKEWAICYKYEGHIYIYCSYITYIFAKKALPTVREWLKQQQSNPTNDKYYMCPNGIWWKEFFGNMVMK